MAVYFCMAFVFLIALGASVVAYAIFHAEEGCEDEQGFHHIEASQNFGATPLPEAPLKKSGFKLYNPDVPLLFL